MCAFVSGFGPTMFGGVCVFRDKDLGDLCGSRHTKLGNMCTSRDKDLGNMCVFGNVRISVV